MLKLDKIPVELENQSGTFYKTKSLSILCKPNLNLYAQKSIERDSTGIIFKHNELIEMGRITTIYIHYLNDNLHNIQLQVKVFKEANCNHFKQLYKLYYNELHSEIIIAIKAVLGRCFFIRAPQIPKYNSAEIIAVVELGD